MPHLKHPLRGGARWLRQATVIGLGIGLMAGTGLIATASAASAHPDAARASAGHKPTRACVLIVGRRGQARLRKRCLASSLVPAPACRIALRPGTHVPPAPRSARLGRAVKGPVAVRLLPGKGRLRILRIMRILRLRAGKQIRLAVPVKGPVARLKPGHGRPQILRLVPGKAVRLAGPKGLRQWIRARACAGTAILGTPPRPLVRICRAAKAHGRAARCCAMAPRALKLGRTVRLKPVRLGRSVRLRIRLAAPVEACAIAIPKRT
jgi:hypothetical protein